MSILKNQLIRHEKLRLRPYRCPAGKLTIGVGRNIEDNGIRMEEAMIMLDNDIKDAMSDVEALFKEFKVESSMVNTARFHALTNVAFNIGRKSLRGFRRMWSAIADRDWGRAADELLDSKYAREVGDRADELSKQLRTGEYDRH